MQIVLFLVALMTVFLPAHLLASPTDPCQEEPFIVDSPADEAIIKSGTYDCPSRTVHLQWHIVADVPNLKIRAGSISVEAPIYNTGDITLITETGDMVMPTTDSVLYSEDGGISLTVRKKDLIAFNAEVYAAKNITGWVMGNLRWAGGLVTTPEDIKFRVWHNVKLLPKDQRLVLQGDHIAFNSEGGDIEFNKIEVEATSFDAKANWQVRAHESHYEVSTFSFTATMQTMFDGSYVFAQKSARFQVSQVCVPNHQPCVHIPFSKIYAGSVVVKTPDRNGINDTILLCESELVDGKSETNPSINGENKLPYEQSTLYDTDGECVVREYSFGAYIE